MYKEVFASEEANKCAEVRIEQKTKETIKKLTDTKQSDSDFMAILHDLCILNRMKDSHDR